MIYDCFTFYNELDLLELRLHELAPVVDRFVLVEATKTHSNQPKPLYFEENKARFSEFLPKIIHIVVSDFPSEPENRWILENYQRNAIMRGLEDCRPDDVVIVSDIDEIVRAEAVLANKGKPGIKFFRQRLYYYFFNCMCTNLTWKQAKMAFYRDLHSPQWLRDYPGQKHPTRLHKYWYRIKRLIGPKDVFIDDGGWHFSYIGGVDSIKLKIKSFAHSELDKEEFLEPDRILSAIERGEDLFGRGLKYEFVPLDDSFPRYLVENRERYRSMIWQMGNLDQTANAL